MKSPSFAPSLQITLATLNIKTRIPDYLLEILTNVPHRGEGRLNKWLFTTAKALHRFLNPEKVGELLRVLTDGEPIRHNEIERAVANSKKYALNSGQKNSPKPPPKWPPLNKEQREAILAGGGGLAELKASSSQLPADDTDPGFYLNKLYRPESLLWLGRSVMIGRTKPLEKWLKLTLVSLSHICPSPMSTPLAMNQEGKPSSRCLNTTGPRRYLVIEFDFGDLNEQSALLLHLAKRAPLALVLHSGNKSLHGWFYCEGQSVERIRQFMSEAVSLGADSHMFTPCQPSRLPNGTRDNRVRQQALFFNPEVIK